MPNHVRTILTIEIGGASTTASALRLQEILDTIAGEESIIDFDKILPQPTAVNIYGEGIPVVQVLPEKAIGAVRTTGMPDPLSWNRAFRGTKWNAYRAEAIEPNVLSFHTAWSHPWPVIQALSLMFRDVRFYVKWADEDLGNNLGAYHVQHGVPGVESFPLPGTKEARDWAAKIHEWEDDEDEDDEYEIPNDEDFVDVKLTGWDQDAATTYALNRLQRDDYHYVKEYALEDLRELVRIGCLMDELAGGVSSSTRDDARYIAGAVKRLQRVGVYNINVTKVNPEAVDQLYRAGYLTKYEMSARR